MSSHPVIVEARPGGNTAIAGVAVAHAPTDGYTPLLTGGSTMSVLPLLADKLPVDPLAGFAPVGKVQLNHVPYKGFAPATLPRCAPASRPSAGRSAHHQGSLHPDRMKRRGRARQFG